MRICAGYLHAVLQHFVGGFDSMPLYIRRPQQGSSPRGTHTTPTISSTHTLDLSQKAKKLYPNSLQWAATVL